MIRIKNFVATGLAPDGKLYAGDLNAIQDAAAAKTDLTQTVSISTLVVGAADLQLLRYGAGTGGITSEGRLSGSLRIDGIFRPLGGLAFPAFTTTQRDAIASGGRPYGLALLNTTTNQVQWNKGTDVAPNWQPIGIDPTGNFTFTGGTSYIYFTGQTAGNWPFAFNRTGDANYRFALREDGQHEWGVGAGARDTAMLRSGAAQIDFTNNSTGYAALRYATMVLVGTAAGNPILRQFLLSSDSQPAFQIDGNGKHSFGVGGSTGLDTFFSRAGVGQIMFGSTPPASDALLSAVKSGNSIEFGHASAGQYHSVLGAEVGSGANFLAFHGAAGTNSGTYRTFGYKASVFKADTAGGFVWATVANANADNQALIPLAYITGYKFGTYHSSGNRSMELDPDGQAAQLPRLNIFHATGFVAAYLDRDHLMLNDTLLTRPAASTFSVRNAGDTAYGTLNAVLTDQSGGAMRVHRHPYANPRHIESGSVSVTTTGTAPTSGSVSVSFTDAFSAAPVVVCCADTSTGGTSYEFASANGTTTTGATLVVFAPTAGPVTTKINWVAEGAD